MRSFWDSQICTISLSCFLCTCLCKFLAELRVLLLCPQPLCLELLGVEEELLSEL